MRWHLALAPLGLAASLFPACGDAGDGGTEGNLSPAEKSYCISGAVCQ